MVISSPWNCEAASHVIFFSEQELDNGSGMLFAQIEYKKLELHVFRKSDKWTLPFEHRPTTCAVGAVEHSYARHLPEQDSKQIFCMRVLGFVATYLSAEVVCSRSCSRLRSRAAYRRMLRAHVRAHCTSAPVWIFEAVEYA